MQRHIKLCLIDDGRCLLVRRLTHLSCSENDCLLVRPLRQKMPDVPCGLKALEYLLRLFDNLADSDSDFRGIDPLQLSCKRRGKCIRPLLHVLGGLARDQKPCPDTSRRRKRDARALRKSIRNRLPLLNRGKGCINDRIKRRRNRTAHCGKLCQHIRRILRRRFVIKQRPDQLLLYKLAAAFHARPQARRMNECIPLRLQLLAHLIQCFLEGIRIDRL